MTGQEFLKWLEQCSMDHRSYNTSSSFAPQVGPVRIEGAEVNVELLKPSARNAAHRQAAVRRCALGRNRSAVNVA